MSLVLTIEPDAAQRTLLRRILSGRLDAELLVVRTKDEALAALAERVPHVVLLSALLAPRDEDALVAHLRSLEQASHLQTLRIPYLEGADTGPRRTRRVGLRLKRRERRPAGQDPDVFAEEVALYLARAHEAQAALGYVRESGAVEAAARPPAGMDRADATLETTFDGNMPSPLFDPPAARGPEAPGQPLVAAGPEASPGADAPDNPQAPHVQEVIEISLDELLDPPPELVRDAPAGSETDRDGEATVASAAEIDRLWASAEIDRVRMETADRRAQELAAIRLEADALRESAIAGARAAAEAEARAALDAEMARVREEAEATLAEAVARMRREADAVRAEADERVGAAAREARQVAETEAARLLAEEASRVKAEAEQALSEELARVRTQAEALLGAQLSRLRVETDAARREDLARAEAEAKLRLQGELERLRHEAQAARRAGAAEQQSLRAEIERVRAETDARLAAEIARLRDEAEAERARELRAIRAQAAELRAAAAAQARAAAAQAVTAGVTKVDTGAAMSSSQPLAAKTVVRVGEPSLNTWTVPPALARQARPAAMDERRTKSPDEASYYSLWRAAAAAGMPPARAPLGATPPAPRRLKLASAACLMLMVGGGVSMDTAWWPERRAAKAAAAQEARLNAAATDARKGALRVDTTPSGARVWLNGRARGHTPLTLADLPPGRHRLVLQSSAGRIERTIAVRAGETTTVAESIIPGWLSVHSRIELEVHVNGRKMGSTHDGQLLLQPGRHQVLLISERFNYRHVQTVRVRPGRVTSHTVSLPSGTVHVTAPAGADIWIEGVRAGEAPLGPLAVPIGTREILIRASDGRERRRVVEVRYGEMTVVDVPD